MDPYLRFYVRIRPYKSTALRRRRSTTAVVPVLHARILPSYSSAIASAVCKNINARISAQYTDRYLRQYRSTLCAVTESYNSSIRSVHFDATEWVCVRDKFLFSSQLKSFLGCKSPLQKSCKYSGKKPLMQHCLLPTKLLIVRFTLSTYKYSMCAYVHSTHPHVCMNDPRLSWRTNRPETPPKKPLIECGNLP